MPFLPRLLQGFVALLALGLSALGGPRLSPDRLGVGDADDQAVVRRADEHLVAAVETLPAEPALAVAVRGDSPAPSPAIGAVRGGLCPALLLGSALGPRAP